MSATGASLRWPGRPELTDRYSERRVLDQLVAAVRSGESQALVLNGEPGVGKTALLDYLADHAPGCRIARTAGVQSEMQFPFAGVHQLCAPMLDRLGRIPDPQRDALWTVFGIRAGPPPDRFLVALAVLSLLAEVAAEQPLICIVDDYQWLDMASAVALSATGRRLGTESVGLVLATPGPSSHLTGLAELAITGLSQADAHTLLDSVLPGNLDPKVRDQIVAETRGNPLALLELSRGLTPSALAVELELPGAVPLEGTIEASFRRRLAALPDETRRLLLIAAADPTGDTMLVWRAAGLLGIGPEAAAPATDAELAEFGTRFRFRHPLVRTAAYRLASAGDRRQAHRALAEATDPQVDPERRIWHRAQAAPGPDDQIAAELDHAANLALARGCLAAAGAYLQRAANLTLDSAQRGRRAVVAAHGKIRVGAFDEALDLLALAEAGSLTDLEHAQVDLVRAQLASITNRGNDVVPLLLKAAKRMAPVDAAEARLTYLDAFSAAIFAGRLARLDGDVPEVARLAAEAPAPSHKPGPTDLLLDGLVATSTGEYADGVPMLRVAITDFANGVSIGDGDGQAGDGQAGRASHVRHADGGPEVSRPVPVAAWRLVLRPPWSAGVKEDTVEELRWLWLMSVAALRVWDDDRWNALSTRHIELAREIGALSELPLALLSRSYFLLFSGALSAAAALSDETQAVSAAIGSHLAPYGALGLGALRGDETETLALVEATIDDVSRRGEGVGITFAEWAKALLHNGLGQYDKALAAAERATAYEADPGSTIWAAVELIEAATRTGATDIAMAAYHRLSEMTAASNTNWARGIQARSLALVAPDGQAEAHYNESMARLGRTRIRTDLARVHLVYGEWLRRRRRPSDAREQLRTAHRMFEAMGMDAFAERARRELLAAGENVRKVTTATRGAELTAQETQIARLARDGLSNPEIATRLFISVHTVQYHLRKTFTKLGITSRAQLKGVLPG
jgi:DNA-binding CsgD family transcriptional regulator/tetratricopeptide (TPR) repeat protein